VLLLLQVRAALPDLSAVQAVLVVSRLWARL
jgi:hypothetical protein